jgi:HK97 family phage prohead protease
MPIPREGETQAEFLDRCIPYVMGEQEGMERDQAAAVCYGLFRKERGKSLDREVRYERPCPEPQFKSGGEVDDPGWIEGYASVFNVVDHQGDVVRPGAFQKTIAERIPAGKVKLMARHYARGGDTLEVIGTITEAKEDEHGLWIHAELSANGTAQNVRQLVHEGHVNNLSIGYRPVQYSDTVDADGKQIRELTELVLAEVTVVARPANDAAVITAAKRVADRAEEPKDAGAPDEGRRESGGKSAPIDGLSREGEPQGTREGRPHSMRLAAQRRKRWLALQRASLGATARRQSSLEG